MASSTRENDDDFASSLSNLKLSGTGGNKKPSRQKRKTEVADSWEDEDSSLSEDEAQKPSSRPSVPSPPPQPPAPVSPQLSSASAPVTVWDSIAGSGASSLRNDPPSRRPEKTDAVARRMIAAGLGLKVPKQTEEQKAYQRSVREQEKKRRDEDRAEEQRRREKAEKAKAAIWND